MIVNGYIAILGYGLSIACVAFVAIGLFQKVREGYDDWYFEREFSKDILMAFVILVVGFVLAIVTKYA